MKSKGELYTTNTTCKNIPIIILISYIHKETKTYFGEKKCLFD